MLCTSPRLPKVPVWRRDGTASVSCCLRARPHRCGRTTNQPFPTEIEAHLDFIIITAIWASGWHRRCTPYAYRQYEREKRLTCVVCYSLSRRRLGRLSRESQDSKRYGLGRRVTKTASADLLIKKPAASRRTWRTAMQQRTE